MKDKDMITMLVKMRDAIDEALDTMNPTKQTTTNTKIEYEKILWVRVKNQKGEPYERYPAYQQQPDTNNTNYLALKEKIKKNSFHQHDGLRYWLFQDNTTIGRKPK